MTTTIQTNVKTAIDEKLGEQAVKEFKKRITEAEGYVEDACDLHAKIFEYEKDANDSYKNIVEIETKMEQIIPVGTIVPYGGEIVETKHGEAFEVREGWLLCNGARLDCKKYEDLFGVIGWAFGAPDSNDPNTFSLPDLRGRVTVGAGSGKRLTKRTLGEKGGEEKHTLTINEMPKHTHDWLKGTARDDSGFGGSEPEYVDKKGTISGLIGFTGGGNSHNNMQPFLVVNYIIKY